MALSLPWTEPPAPGTSVGVAPGVRWIRMPLPFQLDHINVWLLDDGDGWTIVDTGVGLPPTRARWQTAFATELGERPVTRVVITHFHPDHIGNAGWIAERFGAEFRTTEGEWRAAQYALRSRHPQDLDRRLAHYRRHGVPADGLERLRRRGHHYPELVPTLPLACRPIADGASLTIGGRAWRVLVQHGHSPEHACLSCESLGVLIAGDQVLPTITTNISVWPEWPRDNPLAGYLDSLGRLRSLAGDTLVLPSHGLPFRGLHERLDALGQHHDARLAETAGALVEPRTAAEIAATLFRRELDTHQLSFAIGEALAHLNYLEAQGRAVRVAGDDGVERFRKP